MPRRQWFGLQRPGDDVAFVVSFQKTFAGIEQHKAISPRILNHDTFPHRDECCSASADLECDAQSDAAVVNPGHDAVTDGGARIAGRTPPAAATDRMARTLLRSLRVNCR